MKKYYPLIAVLVCCLVVCFHSVGLTAFNCVANQAGNFSDPAIWSGCNSTYPQNGDSVALAGYVVTWDSGAGATLPATGAYTSLTSTGTAGQLALDLSSAFCNSGCALSVTTATAGTKPANAGIIYTSGSTANVLTLTITTATGGSATGATCINHNSIGAIHMTITNCNGSATNAAACFVNNSTGTFTFSGQFTGGGGSTNSHGGENTSTGTGTITGLVKAGAGNSNFGFQSNSTGAVTLNGSLENTSNCVAWSGKPPVWAPTATQYLKLSNGTYLYDETTRNTDPTIAKVQSGTNYKIYNSSLTGTLTTGGGTAWAQ